MALFDLPQEELEAYRPARHEPEDFGAFWSDTLSEARVYALDARFVPVDAGLKTLEVFDVSFAGFGGQRIKGWLLLPRGASGLPCVVEYIGYGGGRGFPSDWLVYASAGYAHLVMDTRGQGSSWRQGDTSDFALESEGPSVPGFMTRGIRDPQGYYYRRLITDAVRAVEAAAAFDRVDAARVAVAGASQGGGLALAVAGLAGMGLAPKLEAVLADVPFLCGYRRALEVTDAPPYGEITAFCKTHRDKVEAVFRTLAYFDGVNFSAHAQAEALFSVGLMDEVCPPSTVYAAYNHYAGPKSLRVWPFNRHEGGESYQVQERLAALRARWGWTGRPRVGRAACKVARMDLSPLDLSHTDLSRTVTEAFRARFGAPPEAVVQAPGRVNLIGEHTDYNDGFVLPLALERATYLALRRRDDTKVVVGSLEKGEATFDLALLEKGSGWAEYLKGVAWALQEDGFALSGFEGVLSSDVPAGAGLSSSAALELATMLGFAVVSGFDWEPKRMAQLAQRAENEWVGAMTGIMDQLISACAEEGSALLIDCRSLETRNVPIPDGTAVVVMDTATRHRHVDSGYNDRRRQCEEAAVFFGVSALRDVTLAQFEAREAELSEPARRRARHIITENARTEAAAAAMQGGDAAALGRLMNESHTSMQGDFEISSTELDLMVELAQAEAGCYGARMTGGGFAGCAVALIAAEAADAFSERVAAAYERRTGLTPALYICRGAPGASVLRGDGPGEGSRR